MGTATGIRFSTVNGYALADNVPADVKAAAGTGAILNVYDSSSRLISGLIDSVGTSEGLGSELITLWSNPGNNPFETFTPNANAHDVDSAINSTGSGRELIPEFSDNLLTKAVLNLTINSGANARWSPMVSSTGYGGAVGITLLSSGLNTVYLTTNGVYTGYTFTRLGFLCLENIDFSALCSCKQVTAPSSSGVVIKDLSGNQNWISKDASFTYNAASYTYEIVTGGGCLVGSSALVGGQILVGHGSLIN